MEEKKEIMRNYVRIPFSILSILVFMFIQTGGAIWWASGITKDLGYVKGEVGNLNVVIEKKMADRYTATEATNDLNRLEVRIRKLEDDHGELDHRVTEFQARINAKWKK